MLTSGLHMPVYKHTENLKLQFNREKSGLWGDSWNGGQIAWVSLFPPLPWACGIPGHTPYPQSQPLTAFYTLAITDVHYLCCYRYCDDHASCSHGVQKLTGSPNTNGL